MCKVSWMTNSIHNVESGKYATKAFAWLKECCGRNADIFHNMESTLWYFAQCEKSNLIFPPFGNYNVDFLICGNYNVDLPIQRIV